jgi:hypothetical protein
MTATLTPFEMLLLAVVVLNLLFTVVHLILLSDLNHKYHFVKMVLALIAQRQGIRYEDVRDLAEAVYNKDWRSKEGFDRD